MGYMRHNAIVVTGMYDHEKYLELARARASELGMAVSPIVAGWANDARSFFVAPDGSKEGWPESNHGDAARDDLVRYLESLRYEDGSSPLAWVEAQFGDDLLETLIVRDSDASAREADAGDRTW